MTECKTVQEHRRCFKYLSFGRISNHNINLSTITSKEIGSSVFHRFHRWPIDISGKRRSSSLPYRNGFRHSINIIWLIFRLVDLYSIGVHSTLKVRRLRWAMCFQNWLRRIWRFWWQLWFMLRFIWQEIVVEFWAFKLALKGPCSTRVGFGWEAVVGRSDCFLNLLSSIHRAFIREAFLRVKGGLHSVLSRGSENCWLILRWRRIRHRVNCNENENDLSLTTRNVWSPTLRHKNNLVNS